MRNVILSAWVTADGYFVEDGSEAQSFMFEMEEDEEQERYGDKRFDAVGEFALGATTYRASERHADQRDGSMRSCTATCGT